jgi:hypothetical protein
MYVFQNLIPLVEVYTDQVKQLLYKTLYMFLSFVVNNVVLIPIPSVNSRFDVLKANYSFEFVETTLYFYANFVRWQLGGICSKDDVAAYIVDN